MKKLKIFLLLSILLCFGFMLSSEVHAQGGGPKAFEEGVVLPATTQLKIFWNDTSFLSDTKEFRIITQSGANIIRYVLVTTNKMYFYVSHTDGSNNWPVKIVWRQDSGWQYFEWGEYYFTDEEGDYNYVICDTSGLDEDKRTIGEIINNLNGDIPVYWEDLNAGPKVFLSDFYNNFDKYFIPAMIIVFGGAIVLTILKVFKGRE